MEDYIKRYSKYTVLLSLVLIIMSIFLIAKPEEFLNTIMILIGILLIVSGIIQIISYFSSPKELKAFSLKLLLGFISIILGIIVIVNTSLINTILTGIIGAWIIIQSIIKLQIAINLKEMANNNWKAVVILSILTLILGIIIIFNPFGAIIAIGRISGITLLVSECINLFESIFMLKL